MGRREELEPKKEKFSNTILLNNLGKISYTLDKEYLLRLSDEYDIKKFDEYSKTRIDDKDVELVSKKNYRGIKVKKIILNKDELAIDCMKNVLCTFSNSGETLAVVINRKHAGANFYFVIKDNKYLTNPKDDNLTTRIEHDSQLLKESLEGNFFGSEFELKEHNEPLDLSFITGSNDIESNNYVSMLSSVPSDKSEKFISQGIEKLLNAIEPAVGQSYTVMILAESIQQGEINEIIAAYEKIATDIAPFESYQFTFGESHTESNGEMSSLTHTDSISHAITKTHSVNVGINGGMSQSSTDGTSKSISNGLTEPTKKAVALAAVAGAVKSVGIVGKIAAIAAAPFTAGVSLSLIPAIDAGEKALDKASQVTKTISETITNFTSKTKSMNLGGSAGYGYSWGTTDTTSSSDSKTEGTNHSISIGTDDQITYTYKSFSITNILERLNENMKRLNESKAVGLWKTSIYAFSQDEILAKKVINFLKGVTQGDKSYIENTVVQTWEGAAAKEILKYLQNFTHPIFYNFSDFCTNAENMFWKDFNLSAMTESEFNENRKSFLDNFSSDSLNNIERRAFEELTFDDFTKYVTKKQQELQSNFNEPIIPVIPTINLTTTELAKLFSFPNKSVAGLDILGCAEFGCNAVQINNAIEIGSIYHMHQNKENQKVLLGLNDLTSHVFVTGSTGSGKSNTIYTLLKNISEEKNKHDNNINFLVIEPAKGEYKNIFGEKLEFYKDEKLDELKDGIAKVYSTNELYSDLIQINPFSFPNCYETKNCIHILEHLDRLIEIFNVCWPMYAAMPAVLKESIEKSYQDAGWNLETSTNKFNRSIYPTFADIMRNIKVIIDSSEYDSDNKGAYKGSLITRLKSLTNGINGKIFTTNELSNKDLFEKNVIVDISRVGSSETKSLLMGLLVLKLQEYRMTQEAMNSKLKHITVLEEAHNLLRRTSSSGNGESGNLQSKSVEMLTNAIAEMRTYGEGFIIADQAPGLLDIAVIRNTNTKIIMRLPDYDDRVLVGKSANLNENQIDELAKLKTGVAAIYQNNWIQPVLCQIPIYPESNTRYHFDGTKRNQNNSLKNRIELVRLLCLTPTEDVRIKDLQEKLINSSDFVFSGFLYANICEYEQYVFRNRNNKDLIPNYKKLPVIVSSLLPEFIQVIRDSSCKNPNDILEWRDVLQSSITQELTRLGCYETLLRNNILQCILQHYVITELNNRTLLKKLESQKLEEHL